jgi:hypothetical protein
MNTASGGTKKSDTLGARRDAVQYVTNIGQLTNVHQAPGSISQVATGGQNVQTASISPPAPEQRLAWWAKFLFALCVLGAIASLILGGFKVVDWTTVAVLVVALLGALPFIVKAGH